MKIAALEETGLKKQVDNQKAVACTDNLSARVIKFSITQEWGYFYDSSFSKKINSDYPASTRPFLASQYD